MLEDIFLNFLSTHVASSLMDAPTWNIVEIYLTVCLSWCYDPPVWSFGKIEQKDRWKKILEIEFRII